MSMSDQDFRNRLIASALRSVEVAAKARRWYEQAEDGHRFRSDEFNTTSAELLESSIGAAIEYGYPIEAIAGAASMSEEQVREIAGGSAAA